MNFKGIQHFTTQADVINFLQDLDFYINLVALFIYIILLIILMIARRGKIDISAKIICIGYPLGVIAQSSWRMQVFKNLHTAESFLILFHDLLVISPSYFVFEMENIRCVTNASTLEHFKISRKKLIIKSIRIASVIVILSTVAAFLQAFS